ncbi:MAG: TonB-dependent siderophore receptor [Pseudomonadota bacterium]|nr:TonB-dependent siderophore receptor [Pseudomonadota bacterium]
MSHSPPPGFRRYPLSAAVCSGLVSLAAVPAHAQTSSTLPAVSVTATPEAEREQSSPKSTAPLLDTPQTISIIPREIFQEQGARNLTDVLRNTPGISFNAGENGFGTDTSDFSLRGFSTSGNIFVDGVRDSGNYARDAFNLEQVEVVKGPAADNGRGGAGGYVNLETKTPKARNFLLGSVGLGLDEYRSDSHLRATLDLNRSFSDSGAIRLNFLAEGGGIAGRHHTERGTFGFAPSVAFGLGTPTTVTLSWQHIEQDDRPDWGVPAAMIEGTLNHDPVAASSFRRDTYFGLMGDTDKVKSDAVMARVEHRFASGLRLMNQTRWSRADRKAFFTIPTNYDPATQEATTQTLGFTRKNTTLSNITNFDKRFSTGGLKHHVAAGLELTREESDSGRHPGVNVGSVSVFNPDPNRAPGGVIPATQFGEVKIDTVAVYAYDTMEINPQWQVTGGLRVERYDVKLASKDAAGGPQGPMDGYERSETTVGGKIGLVYKPVRNGSVYVSYGVSGVPPGSWLSNPDSGREGNNAFPGWDGQNYQGAKEQRLTNIEIGTKWDFFDDRLSTTAAIFRTERKNVAMRSAGGGVPSGYGEQVVQGIELGLAGAITPAWSVFGGLVLLDSERRHGPAVDAALSSDYQGGVTSTSGDELAFTPKATLNLWTTYRVNDRLTVGGGAQYVGSSYVGRPDTADRVIPNGQSGKVPSHTVFSLMAAYDVTRNTRLRLNIENLTDEVYVSSMNWSARRAFLGAPRTVLLSADFRF